MIEKLNLEEVNTLGEATLKAFSILNQLVDAVNELLDRVDTCEHCLLETDKLTDQLIKSNNIHEKQIDELQIKLEPEKCATGTTADKLLDPTPSMLEEVLENIKKEEEKKALEALTPDLQDPYTEQRKWIGKLCKFWDYDGEEKWFSILEYIDKNSPYSYCASGDWWYKHCEPVSPDDDIIYKKDEK